MKKLINQNIRHIKGQSREPNRGTKTGGRAEEPKSLIKKLLSVETGTISTVIVLVSGFVCIFSQSI